MENSIPQAQHEPISESPLWERRTDTPRSPPPEECSGNVFRTNGHHKDELRSRNNSHPQYATNSSEDRSSKKRSDRHELADYRHERPGSRGSSRGSTSSGRYQREFYNSRHHKHSEHRRDDSRSYCRSEAAYRLKSNYSVSSDVKFHAADSGSADKYNRARDARSLISSNSSHRRDFRSSTSSATGSGSDVERQAYKAPYEEFRSRTYSNGGNYHNKHQSDNYHKPRSCRYSSYSSHERSHKKYCEDQEGYDVGGADNSPSSSKSKNADRHAVGSLFPLCDICTVRFEENVFSKFFLPFLDSGNSGKSECVER